MSLSPFEPYLDILEKSLRFLPRAERAEWREEARQHLQEIACCQEKLGLSPDEAMAAAIRQFGDAAQIGHRLAEATESNPLKGRMAAALFSGPLIGAMILLIGLAYAYVFTDSPLLLGGLQLGGAAAFVIIPLLGGWRVGNCLRSGQSPLSVILGLILIGILSLPIAGVLLVPAVGTPVDGAAFDFRWGLLWLPLTFFSLLISHYRNVRRSATAITQD